MPVPVRPLPDHLCHNLQLLLVGINPGSRSAKVGHHYAGVSNRFWKLLTQSRLVPCPLTYRDDWRLPTWGLGLTNLVARPTEGIGDLTREDFALGRRRLLAKIRRYQPGIVAVLGVSLRPILFPETPQPRGLTQTMRNESPLGWQTKPLGGSRVFVLPNPSGRNAHYSYDEMLAWFRRLRRAVPRARVPR